MLERLENLLRGARPSPPPSEEHLQLRKDIKKILNDNKEKYLDQGDWVMVSLDPIIEACRVAFAREIGERLATKFIEE